MKCRANDSPECEQRKSGSCKLATLSRKDDSMNGLSRIRKSWRRILAAAAEFQEIAGKSQAMMSEKGIREQPFNEQIVFGAFQRARVAAKAAGFWSEKRRRYQ